MSIKRQQFDMPALEDAFAPPIDEARRAALRNDPRVRYYFNLTSSSHLETEALIRAAYPFDVRDFYFSDKDDIELDDE